MELYGIVWSWIFFDTLIVERGKNILNFGLDMSSSTKIDNKKKDILILGKGPTQ